ncbi:hypothetical protein PHISCL_10377, partial [Aspergillus sclerotialis]
GANYSETLAFKFAALLPPLWNHTVAVGFTRGTVWPTPRRPRLQRCPPKRSFLMTIPILEKTLRFSPTQKGRRKLNILLVFQCLELPVGFTAHHLSQPPITPRRYENGRRYHGYREGEYMMPNDDREQDRLDLVSAALCYNSTR